MIQTTEITSTEDPAEKPIHARLLFAYEAAANQVKGKLLDIGCGEGRGIHYFMDKIEEYHGIDKIEEVLNKLKVQYPQGNFHHMNIPPLSSFADNTFDTVTTFQVIEHIENDVLFVDEIYRVLKPGGKLFISTPNIKMSLTRNPWHTREYTFKELNTLLSKKFKNVDCQGVYGDKVIMDYFEKNKEGVKKITRFDIFNLQYRLPRKWLQVPYEVANRMNRKKLMEQNDTLISNMSTNNFKLAAATDSCFDLFYIATK